MTGPAFRWFGSIAAATLLAVSGFAPDARAQRVDQWEVYRTPNGEVLDFHPDGVWRRRGRLVSATRARLLGNRNFEVLNRPTRGASVAFSPAAMSGTLEIPTVLFRYADLGTGASRTAAQIGDILYATVPPLSRPYTMNTFYGELSNGLLDLRGQVVGWVTLDSVETSYTGRPPCSGNPTGSDMCNGLFRQVSDGRSAFSLLNAGLREAIAEVDLLIDFGRFDNDGPDGFPNSGDDDGIVDLVLFVHSEQDGACGGDTNNHAWSHKSSGLSGLESDDLAASGNFIRFRDYTIQSGVGGSTGCDPNRAMSIGTTAHETGHALGLPDLYDTGGRTQGIGEWGLMGSGNWSTQTSPARLSPWSLHELGWITVRELTSDGWFELGAVPTSDTTLLIRPDVSNPNGEYFLIENRQPVQADSAMLRVHCERSELAFPSACAGGLGIWHVDSAIVAQRRFFNGLNSGPIPGVHLVQADDLNNLRIAPLNRGDGGDLWPGLTDNRRFSLITAPAATLNATGAFVGFEIDSILPVVSGAPARFFFAFGQPTWVAASDSNAVVVVNGENFQPFVDVLPEGSVHAIGIASEQQSSDGRSRFVFSAWSDGGAREHQITASRTGDSVVATVNASHRIAVVQVGAGSLSADPAIDPAGTFVAGSTPIELTAVADPGSLFDGWSGDTATTRDTLVLPMERPYDVVAVFAPFLTADAEVFLPDGLLAAAYSEQLGVTGGNGVTTWELLSGALPPGVSLETTGLVNGTPSDTGSFSATVRATSGVQSAEQLLSLRVGTPALVAEDVISTLLGGPSSLSASEVAFLDLIGNENGRFDIGDFLAWMDFTAVPVSMERLMELLEHAPADELVKPEGRR